MALLDLLMHKREAAMNARQKYWLGLIVSLTVGVSLKLLSSLPTHDGPPGWWSSEWRRFASEAGGAFIIAFLLAILVDSALKEELLTEFARDVSGHIIGNLLPLRLREHLLGYLGMSLVRERWNITYTLTPCPATQHVKVEVSNNYEMENRSSEEQTFPFTMMVERSFFPTEENRITHVRVNDEVVTVNPEDCQEKGGYVVYESLVKMPPYDKDNPQRRFSFVAKSVQYFFESAILPFISIWPVPEVTVTVLDPTGAYDTLLDPTFETADPPCQTPVDGGNEWKIKEPILPGQGFILRWSKRIPPAAAATAA